MKIQKGAIVPNFTSVDQKGQAFDFYEHTKNTGCVVYFYPKDFTPTCTAEACSFRDEFPAFRGADIPIIGVSPDDVEKHQRFVAEFKLPFTLLADTDKSVGELFGIVMPIFGVYNRVTYFIDKDHRVVEAVQKMFSSQVHVESMLKQVGK